MERSLWYSNFKKMGYDNIICNQPKANILNHVLLYRLSLLVMNIFNHQTCMALAWSLYMHC